jgi:RimJ/RimL family protein N-acetyltransferase
MRSYRTSKTNEIYTKRLKLRYPELDDATEIYACVQSSEFPEQLPLKEMETVEEITKWIKMLQTNWQDGRVYSWIAEIMDTKELIGQVMLSNMKEANKFAIAFWISPKHWMKGYATVVDP